MSTYPPGALLLIDGFPRNFDNMREWRRLMPDTAQEICTLVYDCPEAESERRILSRGESSGRSDDNVYALRRRLESFRVDTKPVLQKLRQDGVKVTVIDGNQSVAEVWKTTRNAVNHILGESVLAFNEDLDRWLREIAECGCETESLLPEHLVHEQILLGLSDSYSLQSLVKQNRRRTAEGVLVGFGCGAGTTPTVDIVGNRTAVLKLGPSSTRVFHLRSGVWRLVHFLA